LISTPAIPDALAGFGRVPGRFEPVDEGQDFSASWWPPTLLALKDADAGGLYVCVDDERETVIEQAAELVIESRVEDRVIAGLQAARVRAAVETLPDEQRTAVSLSFWGGLSQSEIAERTGTPLGTVKSRVRLGMAKLRDRLAAEATE